MVKTITIKTDVYKRLAKAKMPKESFSELFDRLLDASSPTIILSKMRGTVEWKDKTKMLEEISKKRATRRYYR